MYPPPHMTCMYPPPHMTWLVCVPNQQSASTFTLERLHREYFHASAMRPKPQSLNPKPALHCADSPRAAQFEHGRWREHLILRLRHLSHERTLPAQNSRLLRNMQRRRIHTPLFVTRDDAQGRQCPSTFKRTCTKKLRVLLRIFAWDPGPVSSTTRDDYGCQFHGAVPSGQSLIARCRQVAAAAGCAGNTRA
jgi:hypothetical protein